MRTALTNADKYALRCDVKSYIEKGFSLKEVLEILAGEYKPATIRAYYKTFKKAFQEGKEQVEANP